MHGNVRRHFVKVTSRSFDTEIMSNCDKLSAQKSNRKFTSVQTVSCEMLCQRLNLELSSLLLLYLIRWSLNRLEPVADGS